MISQNDYIKYDGMYVNKCEWKLNELTVNCSVVLVSYILECLNFKILSILTYRLHMDVTIVTSSHNTLIIHDILGMWLRFSAKKNQTDCNLVLHFQFLRNI